MEEIIHRIPSHYVREDLNCAQVRLGYTNTMTVFDRNGILFNKTPNNGYVNKYLEDDRRWAFPYNNIPNHIEKNLFFDRINFTNQLFNFNEHYIAICDGGAIDRCVMFDNGTALMATKTYPISMSEEYPFYNETKYMTRDKLDKMFCANHDDEDVFLASATGELYHSKTMGYITEETILKQCKDRWLEQLKKCKDYTNMSEYLDSDAIKFFERQLNNMDKNDLFDHSLPPIIYIIRMNGKDISINMIYTVMLKSNYYKVTIKAIPLTKYTLEQLKYLSSKIIDSKEPRISLRLNPGVSREDLVKAKRLVRSKTNSVNGE